MDVNAIQVCGQSVWLDDLRRHLLQSGELAHLLLDDGIRGVSSNPSSFGKAVVGGTDYGPALERYERGHDATAADIYEHLVIEDIQQAADILHPVYIQFARREGCVSLEVSPALAHDAQATIAEATRLWEKVRRDNLMIKVPATPEGLVAIRELTSRGVKVNVTLLFSRAVSRLADEAYMAGLEALGERGGDLSRVTSVASMFVSPLDSLVDPLLEARIKKATPAEQVQLRGLLGKVAIANAKLAYQDWKEVRRGPRWAALAESGAHPQRLSWASTGAKNPRFRDVLYVEALMGPNTIASISRATLDAFRDHGKAESRLEENVDGARRLMVVLEGTGLHIDDLARRLVDDGVKASSASFDELMGAIEAKRAGVLTSALDRMHSRLPPELDGHVKATLEEWRITGKVRQLWARDKSLWTGHDENLWLDWLDIADQDAESLRPLTTFARQAQRDFRYAVVLGMGGSSLFPDVLARTFGPITNRPRLIVLDSTDPAQIRAVGARIVPAQTLFIVSSKSGTTLEPNLLKDYFYERVREEVGEADASKHFLVVTDPGSVLQAVAEEQMLAQVFLGLPGIGGRYSALSNFGMVPAAVMGIDVPRFLDRAAIMAHACASCVPPEQNPGVVLGTILGLSARAGFDKVTLIASPAIAALGVWLEQLIAESTGKMGKGLIPVDREPLGTPDVYGADRLFAYLRLDGGPDSEQDAAVDAIEKAGHPVVRIAIGEPHDLGQEVFRWEIATAVAGALMGINPFDQPDVEASKVAARTLTDRYDKTGALPRETPFYRDEAFQLFADERHQIGLTKAAGADKTLQGYLRAHLECLDRGDYFAILAFLERSDPYDRQLQMIRTAVRTSRRVATCVGFGPRFLHSTGQAYKGGPNSGVFLQLTCDDAQDLQIPGHRFTFGIVKAAQARGDSYILAARNRRALRVHLVGPDVGRGLEVLFKTIERALASCR